MSDNVFLHDNADRVPPPPVGEHPGTLISGADYERSARLPVQAWLILAGLAFVPLAWLLWRLNGAIDYIGLRWPGLADAILLAVGLACGAGAVLCILLGITRVWLAVQKARLVRSRLGVPIDAVAQSRLSPYVLEQQAIVLELERARYSQYPYLSTLSHTSATNQEPPPALTAQPAQAAPDSFWRAWLSECPHLLISGPTNAGKTTLAKALLADAPGQLLILDPHNQPDKWPVLAVGGGRNYPAIYEAIGSLLDEMNTRFEAYQRGEKAFSPLTCLIDEAPAIALQNEKRWTLLTSQLTSEARKIGIKLIILGQSHLVRDLGLSSLVRRNLGLVALGPQAIDLVGEERNSHRRELLLQLIRGNSRAAAYSYRNEVQILDMANVPALADRRAECAPFVPSVDAENGALSSVRPSVPLSDAERDTLIVRLKREGRNRDEIRNELQRHGIGLPNKDYSLILARLGL